MPALEVRLLTSIRKLKQPQARCGALKGLKGFWWVDVETSQDERKVLKGWNSILEAEGWVDVGKSRGSDKSP